MNTHKSLVSLFSDIANAIRAKTGSGGTIKADNFPSAIRSIETGTDTSDATASASDILSGRTAYGSSGKLTGTIATKAASDVMASENTVTVPAGYYGEAVTKTVGTKKTAQTYTPGTNDQTIAAGQYLTGAQTIKGDADLVAANIKKDVQIFGVTGTYSGTDVSDTTATAADVLSPKKFHAADGTLTTGTIATKTSANVTASGATVTVPAGYYAAQVQKSVASGTAGTPTATKGNVLNHSVTITPKVTNTTGYITGGEKSGTAVTVTASELVSGTKTITANGTGIDVSDYASVTVNVESTKPTLNAPSISLSGSTLTITNPATNGNFVAGYKIYSGQEVSGYVTSTTIDLSSYISESGTHTVTVRAYATGFNDSAASNSVTYTVSSGYTLTIKGRNYWPSLGDGYARDGMIYGDNWNVTIVENYQIIPDDTVVSVEADSEVTIALYPSSSVESITVYRNGEYAATLEAMGDQSYSFIMTDNIRIGGPGTSPYVLNIDDV